MIKELTKIVNFVPGFLLIVMFGYSCLNISAIFSCNIMYDYIVKCLFRLRSFRTVLAFYAITQINFRTCCTCSKNLWLVHFAAWRPFFTFSISFNYRHSQSNNTVKMDYICTVPSTKIPNILKKVYKMSKKHYYYSYEFFLQQTFHLFQQAWY